MKAFAGLSSSSDDESDEDVAMTPAAPEASDAGGSPGGGAAPASDPEALERGEKRFRVELEFLQCLASPLYLEYLAQHNYLDNEPFLAFLRYLTYWKRPEYRRFIEYPDCIRFLDLLLDSKKFRDDIRGQGCRDWVHQHQFERWKTAHERQNRTPDLSIPPEGTPRPPGPFDNV